MKTAKEILALLMDENKTDGWRLCILEVWELKIREDESKKVHDATMKTINEVFKTKTK